MVVQFCQSLVSLQTWNPLSPVTIINRTSSLTRNFNATKTSAGEMKAFIVIEEYCPERI